MAKEKLRGLVQIPFAVLLGTAGLFTLGALLAGCDNPAAQADKTVDQQVETAQNKDTRPEDRKALVAALDSAAKVANASAAAKVNVKLEEARHEVDAADEMARAAGADEIEISRLAGEVQSLTGQISSNNLLIDGLRKREPVDALKGVDDAVAAVKGIGAAATWGAPDKGVPAGSAVDAETARINADIEKLTSERTSLDGKQKQSADEARQLEEQADKGHGTEARDAGVKAAGLRRDARTASTRMEQIDRAIAGLQDQLKVEAASTAALADADKAYQDRKAQIAAGWDEVKKQIDVYQNQSRKLVEGNGDAAAPPPSTQPKMYDAANPPSDEEIAAALRDANVNRLGTLTKKMVSQYDADRDAAIETYEAAYNHITDAQKLAGQAVQGLPTMVSEKEVITGLTDLFSKSDFELRQAAVRLKEAQVHAEQADTVSVWDDTRTALSATLEKAGLQMPADLAGLASGPVADLRKKSEDEYDEADTTLEEAAKGGNTPRARTDQTYARQMEVAEHYARAKDAARAGDTANAETQLKTAKSVLEALNQESPVPDELYLSPELASAIRTAPKLGAVGGPTSGPASVGSASSPEASGSPGGPTTTPAMPATTPSDTTPAATPATAPSDAAPATPTAPDTGTQPSGTPASPTAPDAGTAPPVTPMTVPAAPDATK
jgi:hypothetical protein